MHNHYILGDWKKTWTMLSSLMLLPTACMQPAEQDRELGRQVTRMVEEQMGLVDDPPRLDYIRQLGGRLLAHLDDERFEYRFHIIDQAEPNAFAAPGGAIFVSRGLLATAQSEDELANAIGHEIIHVTMRHTARQLAKSRVPSLFAMPGHLVGSVVGRGVGNLINLPVNTLGAAAIASHSRQDELEADRLGLRLCADAGYDPAALAALLERMETVVELSTGHTRRASFFDTHPTTPDRSRRVRREAQTLTTGAGSPLAPTREAFLGRLDGLLLGENPGNGLFSEQTFLHPVLDLHVAFPAGWKTANAPQFAGAFSPSKDGIALLGIYGAGDDPTKPAQEFIAALEQELKIKPSETREVRIGDWPGYVVTVTDERGREPIGIHFLWVASRGLIYQMIGLAPERQRETLADVARSLRPLTAEERASIQELRLQIVKAYDGETLTALSARTSNAWDVETTAAMNGMSPTQSLRLDEAVKIAVWTPYSGPSLADLDLD